MHWNFLPDNIRLDMERYITGNDVIIYESWGSEYITDK